MTVNDLKRLAAAGCEFARYLFQKVAPVDDDFSGDAIVARHPPDNYPYKEYSNSLITGLPGQPQLCAHIICMVEEGEHFESHFEILRSYDLARATTYSKSDLIGRRFNLGDAIAWFTNALLIRFGLLR